VSVEYDLHHLVPRWLLKDLRQRKLASKMELTVTKINVLIRIKRTLHDDYHRIFGGQTVMEAYHAVEVVFAEMNQPASKHGPAKRGAWARLFGNRSRPEDAKQKLLFWIYFYLFKKDAPSSLPPEKRVYSPEELMARSRLKSIHNDAVAVSRFKKEAWNILFPTASHEHITLKILTAVFDRCSPIG